MSDRVPIRFLRTLLRMAGDKGHDFSLVLSDAGLDFDPLDETDPAFRGEVSAMQYSRLYQSVLRLLQDATFGTTGSELAAPGAFRMMCYCIISCRNLGEAVQRCSEFYRTFFDENSQLYASFSDTCARVGYRTRVRPDSSQVAAADAYGLSVWHRFFGWLCGRPLELQGVDFSGAPPERLARYQALFACPLHFRQPQDLLYFDSACLAWPIVQTEHSLREFLRTAPYQLLLMESSPQAHSLSMQVKAMLGHDFSEGSPRFETISAALNISPPTLRRRLKKEGTSYQRLKDDARCEAAMLCLRDPAVPVNRVALQTGFTDPSAFHRSFKKWTGQTPGQYRLAHGRGKR